MIHHPMKITIVNAKTTYPVACPYCSHGMQWSLQESININSDIKRLWDVLEYDQTYMCEKCGCDVRLNEALPQDVLKGEGWL